MKVEVLKNIKEFLISKKFFILLGILMFSPMVISNHIINASIVVSFFLLWLARFFMQQKITDKKKNGKGMSFNN